MFEALEIDDVRAQVDPTTLGYEAGSQGKPPLDAETDPHERQIVEVLERTVAETRSSLEEHLIQATEAFTDLHAQEPGGDINAAVQDAEIKFNAVKDTRGQELNDLRVETGTRRQDVLQFKRDHRIHRAPSYPDAGRAWLLYGVVAVMFVLESAANAIFLAKGNELGVLGAYTLAFGISFLNLFLPLLLFGPASCFLSHVKVEWRAVAGLGMAVYAGIVLWLNLGVAHYREVSGELIGNAGVEVMRRMWPPQGMQDVESWVLFLIGIFFSLIAFFEGRMLDDAYPGYGKLERAARGARTDHLRTVEDVNQELDEIRETAIDSVKRIARETRTQPMQQQRIARDCQKQCSRFDSHMEHLQQVGEALINEYREANRTARPDAAVPVAHQKRWRLAVPAIDRRGPGAFESVDSPADRIQNLEESYRRATDRINARCNAVRTELLHTTDISAVPGVPTQVPTPAGPGTPT